MSYEDSKMYVNQIKTPHDNTYIRTYKPRNLMTSSHGSMVHGHD